MKDAICLLAKYGSEIIICGNNMFPFNVHDNSESA
jgi:hypothetical protein